nr:MAG TPA: hypothetical protein [Crassvirales sp.]
MHYKEPIIIVRYYYRHISYYNILILNRTWRMRVVSVEKRY